MAETTTEGMTFKKRKPNWTEFEMNVLVEAVADKVEIIKGKFSPSVTHDLKSKTWVTILEKVNAVSSVKRDVKDIQKKWHDAQSIVKKKECERLKCQRKTGGGPASNITFKPWEDMLLRTISATAVKGIEGAVDTAETEEAPCTPSSIPCGSAQIGDTVQETTTYVSGNSANCEDNVEEIETPPKKKRKQADDAFSNPSVQKMLSDLHKMMLTHLIESETKTAPVCKFKQPEDLYQSLDLEIGQDPVSSEKILELCQNVIDHSVKTASPRFMNQLYSGINPSCLAGSWVTETLNTNLHTYEVAPVFVMIERYMMKKLTSIIGYEDGDGVLCPGGSFSNMLGMHLARLRLKPEIKQKGMYGDKKMILFTSEEGHYSIAKGSSFLGFGMDNAVRVKSDAKGMMKPDDLDTQLTQCEEKGDIPTFVMATTGTTVLGACDDLNAIADVCQRHKVWLHVDAAWGGGVILSDKYKHLMDGIHRSDSMAWNIHKMSTGLIQCSLFLVKEKGFLEKCNRFNAEYLFQPDKQYDTSYDIGDKTIQCGRKADILKLWTMWKSRGDSGMAKQVDMAFDNAKYLTERLRSTAGFRLVLPEFQCTNICFWYIPPRLRGKEENSAWWEELSKVAPKIKKGMMQDGTMMIGFNPLTSKGFVNFFRVIVTNPMTTKADMDFILNEMERLGKDL